MKRKFSRGILSLVVSVVAGAGLLVISATAKATPWPVVHLSGTMSANKTISTGTVYVIDSTYTVPSGKTLTIQSGSVIKYAVSSTNSGIKVNTGGTLSVTGTSTSPVSFTSLKDDGPGGDSGGDGATTGSVGDYVSAITTNGGSVAVSYASFKYAGTDVTTTATSGALTISDSTFSNSYIALVKSGGTLSLQRNSFNVDPGTSGMAVQVSGLTNVTGIVLSGVNKNTFSGAGLGLGLRLAGTVPSGSTWTVDSTANVVLNPVNLTVNGTVNLNNTITYTDVDGGVPTPYAVVVNGTLNIAAGSIVKMSYNYSDSGFQVNSGGTLNVTGTSTSPVDFTSAEDDSLGGDTTNDGASSGAVGDYYSAIAPNGGSVNVAHANFKYANTDIADWTTGGGSITVSDSTFANSSVGISHTGAASLQRNNFNLSVYGSDGYAVYIMNDPDVTGIVLSGSNQNTFTTGGYNATLAVSGTVPSSSTWTVASTGDVLLELNNLTVNGTVNLNSNVLYLYSILTTYAMTVNGTANIGAGSIVKVRNDSSTNGIEVNSGGTLNVNGTSSAPVHFTSSEDDSLGGDTSGDGSTMGAIGDYGAAIVPNAGTVSVTHATFDYASGSGAISDQESGVAGSLTVNDSSFANSGVAVSYSGSVSMQRNTFNVNTNFGSSAPVYIGSAPDLTGFALDGANKNVFTGTNATLGFSGTVPIGQMWTVDSSTNVLLKPSYMVVDGTANLNNAVTVPTSGGSDNPGTYAIYVNGTLNIAAGSIVKMANNYATSGIQVNSGGTLNINGTSTTPVYFTSSDDDARGGDTTGNGPTSGAVNDYATAIGINGGSVMSQYAILNYATRSIDMTNGQANFQNTQINNDNWGMSVSNGKLIYRGSITNVSKGIYACNWQFSCNVDAAYVDWGSSAGPFTSPATLVCGSVTVNPWSYGGSTYSNHNLFAIPACDSTASPADDLGTRVTNYMDKIASINLDCSGGNNDACDVASNYIACITAAWGVAAGSSAFGMPTGSPISDPTGYYTAYLSAASSFIESLETGAVTGLTFTVGGDVIDEVTTITTLNSAYDSCFASH